MMNRTELKTEVLEKENRKMKVTELKTNDLEKIVGGAEPPKYLSPEAEAKAKEYAEKAMERIHTCDYIESSSGSGLSRRRNANDEGYTHTGAGYPM